MAAKKKTEETEAPEGSVKARRAARTTKEKDDGAPKGRMAALAIARQQQQSLVGPGADIFSDPLRLNVRGIPLPSIALMYMLGVTAVEASTCIIVDGKTESSKSSLAVEMYNWAKPFMCAGSHVDTENKDARDILFGTVDPVLFWNGTIRQVSTTCIEDAQEELYSAAETSAAANEGLPIDERVPSICILDSIAASASEEHLESVEEQGHADRGKGGRDEALLWTKFFKTFPSKIASLPVYGIFVNHVKEKTVKMGMKDIAVQYNPGGSGQNYAVTIALNCNMPAKVTEYESGRVTVGTIYIRCTKNSRGPTSRSVSVDKYTINRPGGVTQFVWDWGVCTARWLADRPATCPTKKIIVVTSQSKAKFSCKLLGLEGVDPSIIGKAVNENPELVDKLVKALELREIKSFSPLSQGDLDLCTESAYAARRSYYESAGVEIPPYVIDEENAFKARTAKKGTADV